VKERPILFSAPMVRGVLDGSKGQTRRVVKGVPGSVNNIVWDDVGDSWLAISDEGMERELICPYGKPGDRLWVRESTKENCTGSFSFGKYSADETPVFEGFDRNPGSPHRCAEWWYSRKSCPSIHMPRWASRILLEITGVRVERLHDISQDDCRSEGCPGGHDSIPDYGYSATPREHFEWIWESINGKGSFYAANPWLWVIEFKRVE